MRIITRKQFAAVIAAYDTKAMPIGLRVKTDARLKKTGNPYGQVWKLNTVNGFIHDYENSVNLQRAREGMAMTFHAAPRRYGEHLTRAIVQQGDKLFLCVKVQGAGTPIFINDAGKELTKQEVTPFLPVRKPSQTQGTEKEVVFRNYAFDSILSATIDGETYQLA